MTFAEQLRKATSAKMRSLEKDSKEDAINFLTRAGILNKAGVIQRELTIAPDSELPRQRQTIKKKRSA